MFAGLLKHFAEQSIPADTSLTWIFVENDHRIHIEETVDAFRRDLASRGITGHRVIVESEPRPGISFARNRVLDLAFDQDLDYLIFTDDDEYPAQDWIRELSQEAQTRHLDIAGGLDRLGPMPEQAGRSSWRTRISAMVHRELERRSLNITAEHFDLFNAGEDFRIHHIRGANMILRLAFLREHAIRFIEDLGAAPGGDLAILNDVLGAGGRYGWIPTAVMHERARDSRLTLGYQFHVHRHWSIVRYGFRYQGKIGPQHAKHQRLQSAAIALARLAIGTVRLLMVPFNNGQSLVRGVWSLGIAVGRIEGLFAGKASRHYMATDGD